MLFQLFRPSLVTESFRLTARIQIYLSAKIVGTALVRLGPRLHPDGQFQPDSKFAFRQKLAVNNLPACPHALFRRDHNHLLPRPPLPFHENACAVRAHVFGQRPRFRHFFVFRANLYRHRPRNPLFESATRHRHRLPRLPQNRRSSLSCRWVACSPTVRLQFGWPRFYVYVARFACPAVPRMRGSLSQPRIEVLLLGGPDARALPVWASENWITLARMAAKWVETVIPQQVNCVVRPRTLEPLLPGNIQRVGRMQKGGSRQS